MNPDSIKTINDLKRDVLEKFIASLPREDKENIKTFLKEHPQKNAAGIFTAVRAYVFNTYFRKTPVRERRDVTFADTLASLLEDNEDNAEEAQGEKNEY